MSILAIPTADFLGALPKKAGTLMPEFRSCCGSPTRGRRALRYFFHVTDGTSMFKDEEGQKFSSLNHAKANAMLIASELAHDETYRGWALSVTDDQGNEVARVAIVGPGS